MDAIDCLVAVNRMAPRSPCNSLSDSPMPLCNSKIPGNAASERKKNNQTQVCQNNEILSH